MAIVEKGPPDLTRQSLALLGKTPPHHIEAERSVLGALLLHDEQVVAVLELLTANDFYLPAHRSIYAAIVALVGQQQRIDLITLQDELIKEGVLDAVGGMVYLVSLQEEIPMLGLVEQHARIVKEKAVLRELIGSAAAIVAQCYAQDNQRLEAVLDEAEKRIFQIAEKRSQQSFVQLTICLTNAIRHLADIGQAGGQLKGVTTGFHKLDEMTSGFQSSDLIVLAARPSMGKTALALRFAYEAALSDKVVGIFSLEMSSEQLVMRLLSSASQIGHHAVRNGSLSSDQWRDLTTAAGELSRLKLFIDDTALQSIMDIRTKARKLKRDHGLQVLIIDYLQLIHSSKVHENRNQEVAEISRSLKALAKELQIPIIALSQLSRAVESRVDKRPMLSDLRESGAIEQDADLIMFLYRDIVYNPDTENPGAAELIIGKHRNGQTGTVHMHYHRELTSFVDTQ